MTTPKSKLLSSLDDFTRAYIECALWSSIAYKDRDDEDGEPMDRNHGTEDISVNSLKRMISDCKAFQEDNQAQLEEAVNTGSYVLSQAGHDFWLSRNRHGAGFWDRGLKEVGEALHQAAKDWGSCDLRLFRGKIWLE
jgi:hypothetical protein